EHLLVPILGRSRDGHAVRAAECLRHAPSGSADSWWTLSIARFPGQRTPTGGTTRCGPGAPSGAFGVTGSAHPLPSARRGYAAGVRVSGREIMRDQQGFTDFATARAGDLRRQAYLLTGSPERAVRLADKALAETGRRWDRLGGVVAAGSLRGRGVTPAVALTARGTAAPTDDAGEAVRRALAGLPPRRRAVLVLRYDEGLDDAAVGARLGLPPAQAAAEGEAGLVTLRSLLRRRGRPEDLLPTALAETPLPIPLSPPSHPSGPAAGAEPARFDAPAGPAASEDAAVGAAAGNSVAPAARPAAPPAPPAAADAPAGDVPAGDVPAGDVPSADGRPGSVGAASSSSSLAGKNGAPARDAGGGSGA